MLHVLLIFISFFKFIFFINFSKNFIEGKLLTNNFIFSVIEILFSLVFEYLKLVLFYFTFSLNKNLENKV